MIFISSYLGVACVDFTLMTYFLYIKLKPSEREMLLGCVNFSSIRSIMLTLLSLLIHTMLVPKFVDFPKTIFDLSKVPLV